MLREGAQEQLGSKRLALVQLKLLAGNDLEELDDDVDKQISHYVRGVGLTLDCRHAQPQEPAELMVHGQTSANEPCGHFTIEMMAM